jgi:hypothetical protein
MHCSSRCRQLEDCNPNRIGLRGAYVCASIVALVLASPIAAQQGKSKPKKPPATTTGTEKPKTQPEAKKETQKKPAPAPPKRFYEREPYDVITLDQANDNLVLKVMPLQLPERKLPEPSKRVGKLTLRLLDKRQEEYEVMWRHVAKVDLFEGLVLQEAQKIFMQAAQQGRTRNVDESARLFDEAYDYFHWLLRFHPNVVGLEKALQDYLYLNAGTQYLVGTGYEADSEKASDEEESARLKKQAYEAYAQAFATLEELNARNPQYAFGAASNTAIAAMERVGDRLVGWYAKDGDFVSTRTLLVRLQRDYRDKLQVTKTWRDRLIAGAASRRDVAADHLSAGRLQQAHDASREMLKIWPQVEGGRELVLEIARQFPLIVVSVAQPALTLDPASLEDFAARRAGYLVYPTLIEYQQRGPEGGRYASPFGMVQQSDDRMQLIFDLRSEDAARSFTGYDLSRNLLAITDYGSPRYDPSWSSLMASLQVEDVMRVRVALRRPHVLPQSMLRTTFHVGKDVSSRYSVNRPSETETRFDPLMSSEDGDQVRPVIIERFNPEPRAAIEELRKGKIDMIDRLLPADALRLQGEAGIQIGTYSFPSLFVLAPNTENPYLANKAFRRALTYGINREVILNKGLLNGRQVEGSRVISAPVPAGITPNDPSAYAYDERIKPYPYDPVMAAILVGLASKQLAVVAEKREEPVPELGELVLAHPFGELHRFIAKQIQAQFEIFDLACKLRELSPGESRVSDGQYDLLLMEIRMLEPLVDLPRLMAREGVVPSDDPYVSLAIRRLDNSENWKEARENLYELHQMLKNDLPLIPLWQMIEYFAYHEGLRGVQQRPVFFYHDVEKWRVIPPEQQD